MFLARCFNSFHFRKKQDGVEIALRRAVVQQLPALIERNRQSRPMTSASVSVIEGSRVVLSVRSR